MASELAMSKKSSKIKGFRDRKKYFCEYLTHSDDLGRVVVPKEIRRTMRIREGEPMEIFTGREGEIVLKKYSPIGEMSEFARTFAELLAQNLGALVCISDHDQIIAASGPEQREYLGRSISREMEELIQERAQKCTGKDGESFKIVDGNDRRFRATVIQPIISAGDAIGAVMILDSREQAVAGEAQQKLAAVTASFQGRQMES